MQPTVQFDEQRSRGAFSEYAAGAAVAGPAHPPGERGAPRVGILQRSAGSQFAKVAERFLFLVGAGDHLKPHADHRLSKGWAKRMYFVDGARISCREGKLWITHDKGGGDIVLEACNSKSFGPGTRVLVEALTTSRISLEAL